MNLIHPSLSSRAEDVMTVFATLSSAATAGEYVELDDLTKIIINESDRFKNDDDKNCFKGDIFEVFCEVYYALIKSKNSAGVIDYKPLHASADDDMGVDGTGINYSGNPCVVQVKFRSNPKDEISYSALANTYTQASALDMIPESRKKQRRTIVLFTNCAGANKNAHSVLGKQDWLFVINKEVIESEVNGNVIFWQEAYNLIKNNID
jgi:hypothetical protein